MNTDFLDAHHRHWQDAEQLFDASRWANADHLYGLAAECGLKRLMVAFGMVLDRATSAPPREDRAHVMEKKKTSAWDRYESYRSGCGQGAHYGLSPVNPFANWDVAQRYDHQRHFCQDRVGVHRIGAEDVRSLVKKARLEGLL